MSLFLCLDALYIGTVAGVDTHFVAYVAEEGYADFGSGFHCCGLESVGGGVALYAGFGVCDFENDAGGHFACQDGVGSCVYHSFADVAFLEELYAVDAFTGDGYLFESFGVHEVVAHVVLVKELVGAAFDAYFLNLYT